MKRLTVLLAILFVLSLTLSACVMEGLTPDSASGPSYYYDKTRKVSRYVEEGRSCLKDRPNADRPAH